MPFVGVIGPYFIEALGPGVITVQTCVRCASASASAGQAIAMVFPGLGDPALGCTNRQGSSLIEDVPFECNSGLTLNRLETRRSLSARFQWTSRPRPEVRRLRGPAPLTDIFWCRFVPCCDTTPQNRTGQDSRAARL